MAATIQVDASCRDQPRSFLSKQRTLCVMVRPETGSALHKQLLLWAARPSTHQNTWNGYTSRTLCKGRLGNRPPFPLTGRRPCNQGAYRATQSLRGPQSSRVFASRSLASFPSTIRRESNPEGGCTEVPRSPGEDGSEVTSKACASQAAES